MYWIGQAVLTAAIGFVVFICGYVEYVNGQDWILFAGMALYTAFPFIALVFINHKYKKTGRKYWLLVPGELILGIATVFLYIDAFFIHIDALNMLVLALFPIYQYVAIFLLVGIDGLVRKLIKRKDAVILIKPHHFIDIITAFGDGTREFEPHPYGHAVHAVAAALLADRRTMLQMETGIDAICRPCRHNVNGACDDTIDTSFRPDAPQSKGAWNLMIDGRWCERLGIGPGDRFAADDFCRLIRDRLGDITAIYREIPAAMTAERQAGLIKGLAFYLED